MAEARVRPAVAADLDAVAAIARAAYAPYVPRMGRRPAPMVADFAAHLARGELAVLEDGGGVVAGYVVMFAKPGAWFVENVAVDPARHGTGLGRALMGHAESAARAAGHGRLTLYTNIHMTENLAFYPRLGFSETHRVTEDGFDRVYMEKVLVTAPSPVTGFDHALVGVADLEAARRDWARLGFTLCPRGRHIGWGTANYCLMFADDYIELLGIVDPTQFTNNLDQRLAERGEGLMGMALAGADPAATHAALAHAGAREPQALKRLLELPGGDVVPEFSLVHLPPAATPGLPAFVCHHLTPHLMRRPEWLRHANGATGLASVTVRVPDPAAAAAAYAATFGAAAVDGTRVRLGRHMIDLISGDLGAGDGGPAALAVRVADLAEAAEWLAAERIDFTETAAGLRLDPARATGVDLTLVP